MSGSRGTVSLHAIGVCVLLTATLAAVKVTSHRTTAALVASLDTIPMELRGFVGTTNPPLPDSVVDELKASSYISRRYVKDGLDADLFVAYYAQQRAGESMHSPKHCLPGAGWEIWNYETVQIPAAGRNFAVNSYSISKAGERRLVLYWYQSKERIFASEYLGKVLLARDALLQSSTAASIVRVIVPDRPGAREEACAIASEMVVQMQRCFGL